ncbi:uncharacterized protein LOC113549619 [Rhopalosiphum maidis]|uniref:uncharacterized protein LOC113549619 n=1 Tax=Rhopalosiphum maidis TaxID=43146 RepID=UPI000F0052E3|nr:uncharacterized protein LOC113549619 [Rhopalosiphum maidis]
MAVFNDHNAAINLKILKQCGFYQIFYPNGENIFGWNIYRLSFIALTVITQCLIGFGNCGFLFDLEDTIDNIDLFLIIFSNAFNYLTLWKVIILMFYRNKILDLMDVTSLKFLNSEHCQRNIKILYKHRNRALQRSKLYFNFCILVYIPWIIYPIIINSFVANKNDNRRLENIINRRYPMAVNTYNQYYVLFYIIETIIAIKSLYLVLMIDILLLSIGWAIIVQYEVLAVTFKNIGNIINLRKDHDYNNVVDEDDCKIFKSIIFDQQQLDLKVKLYFFIVKPIVLMHVAISSGLIIMLSNAFIMVVLSTESFAITIVNLFKIGVGIFYLCLQLFLYCYLFDNINLKRESVNFGIYSCNWTKLNLIFKKRLLLTMQINDANRISMKASTKKIVNLQLFANVLTMSYNIISVMVKTIGKQ